MCVCVCMCLYVCVCVFVYTIYTPCAGLYQVHPFLIIKVTFISFVSCNLVKYTSIYPAQRYSENHPRPLKSTSDIARGLNLVKTNRKSEGN